jgi:uncharacterized membrane protein YbhN (UPF0104 family)
VAAWIIQTQRAFPRMHLALERAASRSEWNGRSKDVASNQHKMRSILTFGGKLLVAVGLGYWLISTRTLDASSLRVLKEPRILLYTVLLLFCVSIGAATLRWMVLLRAYGVSIHPLRAAALQLMGLFFNAVIPGNLGGDFVKNLYVVRGRPVDVLALAVTERLLGMIALIWAGWLITLFNAPYVLAQPALAPFLGLLTVLALGSVLGPLVVVLLLPRVLKGEWPGLLGRVALQLRGAVQVLRDKPKSGLVVFSISLLIHTGNLTYFYQITSALLGYDPPISALSVIIPIGLLTMVLPVSVAGVGVGHMAFDQLFSAVGLTGGANAFHVFLVGNVGPMLLGAIPYLVLRRTRPADGTLVPPSVR